MEVAFAVITVVSVGLAAITALTAWRAVRTERHRSEARVAWLAAAAYAPDRPTRRSPQPERPAERGDWVGPLISWQSNPDGAPEEGLFRTVRRADPGPRRLGLAAASASLVLSVAAASIITGARHGSPPIAASVERPAPLQLVSLAHIREPQGLTIAGAVRNPTGSTKVEGLTAVVSLLDQSGHLISTRDVPLDYRALAPGEETPFSVTVPDLGSIRRYRVSFRAGRDVIPHVDRRTEPAAAAQGV